MIKFTNVGLRYGSDPEILHGINLDIKEGSFHYLTGASGAGKSSLLQLIYLVHRQSRGFISLFDNDISKIKRKKAAELRRNIGVVFQDFKLVEHLNIFDNIALPLRIAGNDEKTIEQNVTEILEWIGIEKYKEKLPATLSGGQKQQIAIARAVITRPKLLLADEPTGSIDDKQANKLMGLFEAMHNIGISIIIATHNEAIMKKFPHPILQIEKGYINYKND